MIRGIVVNKKTYRVFQRLPLKVPALWFIMDGEMPMVSHPWNSVRIYVKPYLRWATICYTEEQLKEVLNGKNNL